MFQNFVDGQWVTDFVFLIRPKRERFNTRVVAFLSQLEH